MGRTKVLHVIGGGEFGGAEQHLLTLIKHIDRTEFEIHTACLFGEPLAPLVVKEGFQAHVFPMQSKFDWKPIGNLVSLIKTEGFHIVHTHGIRANLIGRVAARRAGVKHIVTTVHSVLAFDYNSWLARKINRLCENTTRTVTEKFITVCDVLAKQLVSEGVPASKITTVHNGLEIEKYDPNTLGARIRTEFGIGQDAVVMGIVARLHPVKGHALLFDAMARAIEHNSNLILMVVGTGPNREELQNRCHRLGLDKHVIFTGFRRDIPEIIASLNFLVLPSLSEGLSLTIMEGMAMKKPVLATAVGGTPEIITHGVDGYLVPPSDIDALAKGITWMAQDAHRAVAMGQSARKTIEAKFTAELMAAKTSQIYKDIVH